MKRRQAKTVLLAAFLVGCAVDDDLLEGDELLDDEPALAAAQVLSAVADTEVRQATPTTNYGSLAEIGSDADPVRHAYLRFDLRNLQGTVTRATLRCYVDNASVDGPSIYATASSWSETSMTWNNRPAPTGSALVNLGAVNYGTWLEANVTAAVRSGQLVSFAIVPTSTDSVICRSRESSANRPQLSVELTQTPTPTVPPAGYVLRWSDEFDGAAVNAAKWNILERSNYGAANKEDQCYYARNARVSGGTLKIDGKRETTACNQTNPDGGNSTYYFTSGFLTTRAMSGPLKYKFRHGYVEAAIKNPKGNPYWGALWLVGANDGSTPGWPDYGEFDITEVTSIKPDITHGSLWYQSTSGAASTSAANIYNLVTRSGYPGSSNWGTTQTAANLDAYNGPVTSRFVRYGFLWEPNQITWYVDGVPVRRFNGQQLVRFNADGTTTLEKTVGVDMAAPAIPFSTVFNYDHSINLNLAIGGGFPRWYGYSGIETATGYSNGNLAAVMPAPMEVDYVRVYQLP